MQGLRSWSGSKREMENFMIPPIAPGAARSHRSAPEKYLQHPQGHARDRQGHDREQEAAQTGRPCIVDQHVAQPDPKVPQQRGEEHDDRDADQRLVDPSAPFRERLPWMKQEEAGGCQHEEQHVNRRPALHQPGTQAAGGGFHSHSAPTSSAIATPHRFTAQALRRAVNRVEPTLTSVSKCRTPARIWCARAHANNSAGPLNAEESTHRATSAKPCSSRSETSSRYSATGRPAASSTPLIRCAIEVSAPTGNWIRMTSKKTGRAGTRDARVMVEASFRKLLQCRVPHVLRRRPDSPLPAR